MSDNTNQPAVPRCPTTDQGCRRRPLQRGTQNSRKRIHFVGFSGGNGHIGGPKGTVGCTVFQVVAEL